MRNHPITCTECNKTFNGDEVTTIFEFSNRHPINKHECYEKVSAIENPIDRLTASYKLGAHKKDYYDWGIETLREQGFRPSNHLTVVK